MSLSRLAIKLTLFWKSRDSREEPKQAYSHDPHLNLFNQSFVKNSVKSRRSTQYDFLSSFQQIFFRPFTSSYRERFGEGIFQKWKDLWNPYFQRTFDRKTEQAR